MAQWHVDELRGALERKGWRVTQIAGDDYKISATWELHRAGDPRVMFIDFDGHNDLHVLPLAESYACRVRSTQHSLYFRRRGDAGSAARARWRSELLAFVEAFSAQAAV